jgi:hypothetical protein
VPAMSAFAVKLSAERKTALEYKAVSETFFATEGQGANTGGGAAFVRTDFCRFPDRFAATG